MKFPFHWQLATILKPKRQLTAFELSFAFPSDNWKDRTAREYTGWLGCGGGGVRRRDNSDITIRLLEEENKSFDKANHSRIQLGKEKEYYDVWILINKW